MSEFLQLRAGRGAPGTRQLLSVDATAAPRLTLSPEGDIDHKRHAAWRLTSDGRIVGGQRSSLALQVSDGGELRAVHTSGEAKAGGWTTDSQSRLVQPTTGRIAVARPGQNGTVSLQLVASDAINEADSPVFVIAAGDLINGILTQPPQAWPPFTGGQVAAYAYVCQQLAGGKDFRTLYLDGSVVQTLASELAALTCPEGASFNAQDLASVVNTLNPEITAAQKVSNLYGENKSFFKDVFDRNTSSLSLIQQDLTIANTTVLNLTPALAVQLVIYTVLSAMGTAGGFIANVMATAYNTAVAAATLPSDAQDFQFANLLSDLLSKVSSVQTTLATQEDAILSDYGRLTALAALCNTTLAYTNTGYDTAVNAAQCSYTCQVLQQVMPQYCTLHTIYFSPDSSTTKAPTYAQNTWNTGAGYFIYYFKMQSGKDVPQDIFTLMFKVPSVAPVTDVFIGMNGWIWTSRAVEPSYYLNDNYLIVSVFNATSDDLQMKVKPEDGCLASPNVKNGNETTLQLKANYPGIFIASWQVGGLTSKVDIQTTSGADLVKFEAQQNAAVLKGGQITVTVKEQNAPYSITSTNQRGATSGPVMAGQVWAILTANS